MDLVIPCVQCCCEGCCAQTSTGYNGVYDDRDLRLTESPASTAMSRETQDPPLELTDPTFRF